MPRDFTLPRTDGNGTCVTFCPCRCKFRLHQLYRILTPIVLADCDPPTPACPGFGGINCCTTATGKLLLPTFGLAPYKFRASIWTSDRTQERDRVTSLMQEADSWLRRIHVDHPDFRFFVSHFSTTWRWLMAVNGFLVWLLPRRPNWTP